MEFKKGGHRGPPLRSIHIRAQLAVPLQRLTKANYLERFYNLKPGEKTEIPLSFTIEYPLGKEINIK